jgi:zinc transporter
MWTHVPLFAFDIWSDGRASAVQDNAPTGPGTYRWFHFDLSDTSLRDWSLAHLPELAANALVHSETRPRCDPLGDGVILNLRGANLNPGQPIDQMVSIRMWVTGQTVVTVRLRKVFALDDIRAACVQNAAPASADAFVSTLVGGLATRVRDVMLDAETQTEVLEDALEGDPELETTEIARTRRKAIRLLRYLNPQREALGNLLALDTGLFSESNNLVLREHANLFDLTGEALEALKHRLEALQAEADTQAAKRIGRNSYVLSLVAAVFLPLGFLTGLFGVNVAGMPGIDWPGAFFVLSAAMVLVGLGCILVLRWLRLL